MFILIDNYTKPGYPKIGFCLYEKGELVQYHMPKRNSSQNFIPLSLNNKGDIVVEKSSGTRKSFVWSCDGKKIACDEDRLGNGREGKGYPTAINDAQQIVGHLKISTTYNPETNVYIITF